jgi:hypothetical protein
VIRWIAGKHQLRNLVTARVERESLPDLLEVGASRTAIIGSQHGDPPSSVDGYFDRIASFVPA